MPDLTPSGPHDSWPWIDATEAAEFDDPILDDDDDDDDDDDECDEFPAAADIITCDWSVFFRFSKAEEGPIFTAEPVDPWPAINAWLDAQPDPRPEVWDMDEMGNVTRVNPPKVSPDPSRN